MSIFIPKFHLEFILHSPSGSIEGLKSSLSEFGEELQVSRCEGEEAKEKDFRVSMKTEDPTLIFDICAQIGRIKTVKIEEEKGV